MLHSELSSSFVFKLVESDMWLSEKFTKPQALIDIVYLREKDGEFPTQRDLAKRWKWSQASVYRFLLENG